MIDRLVLTLPDKVASNLESWHAFVAIADGRVVGTGSLNGQTVSSVYVHPDYQRHGIATKLMDAIGERGDCSGRGEVKRAVIDHRAAVLRKAWLQDYSGGVLR